LGWLGGPKESQRRLIIYVWVPGRGAKTLMLGFGNIKKRTWGCKKGLARAGGLHNKTVQSGEGLNKGDAKVPKKRQSNHGPTSGSKVSTREKKSGGSWDKGGKGNWGVSEGMGVGGGSVGMGDSQGEG